MFPSSGIHGTHNHQIVKAVSSLIYSEVNGLGRRIVGHLPMHTQARTQVAFQWMANNSVMEPRILVDVEHSPWNRSLFVRSQSDVGTAHFPDPVYLDVAVPV